MGKVLMGPNDIGDSDRSCNTPGWPPQHPFFSCQLTSLAFLCHPLRVLEHDTATSIQHGQCSPAASVCKPVGEVLDGIKMVRDIKLFLTPLGITRISPACQSSVIRTWVPTWQSSPACTSASSTVCRRCTRSTPTSSNTKTRWAPVWSNGMEKNGVSFLWSPVYLFWLMPWGHLNSITLITSPHWEGLEGIITIRVHIRGWAYHMMELMELHEMGRACTVR